MKTLLKTCVGIMTVLCIIGIIGACDNVEYSDTVEYSDSEEHLNLAEDSDLPKHSDSEEHLDSAEDSSTAEQSLNSSEIPSYAGIPYTELNGNVPEFTQEELTTTSFESYSPLDDLGRCGVAYANIGVDLMPTKERGAIGQVKPAGWHTVKYNGFIDGNYLYNRVHLIGYQLTGENANEQNLITGTRYLNVEGMLPFENMVAEYIKQTGNHVLYRVTPVYDGNNLIANGVRMEGMSVEDKGAGILFHVYCYNVQPDITIDYATGDSFLNEEAAAKDYVVGSEGNTQKDNEKENSTDAITKITESTARSGTGQSTYILNTNTMKFHYGYCSSVNQIKDSNKREYTGSRNDLISQGYEPCKRCNP